MESIGWNRTLGLIQLNDCNDPHLGNADIAKVPSVEVPLSFARRLGLPACGGYAFRAIVGDKACRNAREFVGAGRLRGIRTTFGETPARFDLDQISNLDWLAL